jgi:hypothetical protein
MIMRRNLLRESISTAFFISKWDLFLICFRVGKGEEILELFLISFKFVLTIESLWKILFIIEKEWKKNLHIEMFCLLSLIEIRFVISCLNALFQFIYWVAFIIIFFCFSLILCPFQTKLNSHVNCDIYQSRVKEIKTYPININCNLRIYPLTSWMICFESWICRHTTILLQT